ncbi:MAG TPA: hypothetical protein VMX17_05190 [Candidatus Glassbacteria bacterium]|nr:hypothetical protein [Candidatus Glassbacteria bacterium]
MTRQETIDSLQIILDEKNNHLIIAMHAEALVKTIKVLSEMSNNEFEYLTFPISKGE